MQVQIKRASVNEAELISDLSVVTFIQTYRGTCPDGDLNDFMDKYFNEDLIRTELEDENDFYFIAFADGFPAGYMRLKEEYDEFPLSEKCKAIHLKRIYVLKEYQSKKVGAALMSFALQFSADKNFELLWLGVWEGNEKAVSFYKKWDFKNIKPYTFHVGNTIHTDYWMTKIIERS